MAMSMVGCVGGVPRTRKRPRDRCARDAGRSACAWHVPANPTMEVANANPATGADVIVSSLANGANWALTTVLPNAIEFAARRGRKAW